ncbi:MAG: reactive intermediate/imine deaminase [Zetaproteobacteria bacterium]|nr:reactive intermediate/imine deaminase [Pseudobdellovibrionaceae bacterium]
MFTAIETQKAPKAIGPYSQAVLANGFLMTSGQIAIDPNTGKLIHGTIEDQASLILDNIKSILSAHNLTLSYVVKTNIFLTDLSLFERVNRVYMEYFQKPYPVRSTVGVAALPLGAIIEIDAIAIL